MRVDRCEHRDGAACWCLSVLYDWDTGRARAIVNGVPDPFASLQSAPVFPVPLRRAAFGDERF